MININYNHKNKSINSISYRLYKYIILINFVFINNKVLTCHWVEKYQYVYIDFNRDLITVTAVE